MAENSNIEWTDHTFNPWIGCQKVGPGCDHCYAETWDARGLQGAATRWGPDADRTRTGAANWNKPRTWDRKAKETGRRARVFCASLADVFDNHKSILPEWRRDLWRLIAETPNLDWLMLTKRPGNILKMLPDDWGNRYANVWLGCTVVNQEEADRDIPKLLVIPAKVRFLSMEPLLGPVALNNIRLPNGDWLNAFTGEIHDPGTGCIVSEGYGLDWIIAGGESGHHARPLDPDWVRSLRDQCVAAAVPYLFKQWGEWAPAGSAMPGDHLDMDRDTMVRVGKKRAGRLLDGRDWTEFPGDWS